jgi:serine/threonine-protein kinase
MGSVYRAYDTSLGRVVAIKVLDERFAEDPDLRMRFEREARAAARLSGHPGSVTIYDVGECDGRPYIVMELLDGGTLEQRLRDGAPPLPLALRWLEQAASAIDAAHAAGIVHRDVKPANLLLDPAQNVHVADFGIASAAGLDALTRAGTIMGTAGYLSPEQASGDRAAAASDRYALGVVAYELLTGRRPYARESPTAEAAAHVHEAVPSACTQRGDLPCEVDPVFERALAKEPAARYPTCAAFVGALRNAFAAAAGTTAGIPVPQLPQPPQQQPAPRSRTVFLDPPRRRRSLAAPLLLGLVILAAAGAAAAYLLTRDHTTTAPIVKTQVITRPGITHSVTQTRVITQHAPAPVTSAAAVTTSPAASATPVSGSGRSLNDQGYARMQAGDYNGALPLLQHAVAALAGAGYPYEAYANFNLGYTLLQLGRCGDAVPYLQKADRLEPGNRYVAMALQRAGAC